jgi:hypothetical protein
MEVLRLAYRSEDAEPSERADAESSQDEARQALAGRAFRLLCEWRRPPGMDDEGRFDEKALSASSPAAVTDS